MSMEGIRAAAGGALVQVGSVLEAGRAWAGSTVVWLKDTVVGWDIPSYLFAIWRFIASTLGQTFNWTSKTVTHYGGQAWALGSRVTSWSLNTTNAAREVAVKQGSRALSYSSEQITSASTMTYGFLVTNLGIAATAGPISLAMLFAANHYLAPEQKGLRLALTVSAAAGLVITGFALGAPTPILLGMV